MRETLREFGKEDQLSRLRVMMNTIAVGASLAVLDYDVELFAERSSARVSKVTAATSAR